MNDIKLILASGSPRRREMMELVGYDYEIVVSDADENVPECEPARYVEQLARRKAQAVFEKHPDCCVVGADTIVLIDGTIIGKPKDRNDAYRILRTLSGRMHTVYTGVAVLSPTGEQMFSDTTDVTFMPLADSEIWRYIDSGEPMDKAGAYGIQGLGAVLVRRVDGCYFTVIGMPLPRLYQALKLCGILPRAMSAE